MPTSPDPSAFITQRRRPPRPPPHVSGPTARIKTEPRSDALYRFLASFMTKEVLRSTRCDRPDH